MKTFQIKQSNHLNIIKHFIGSKIKDTWNKKDTNFDEKIEEARTHLEKYCNFSTDDNNVFLAIDSCRKRDRRVNKKRVKKHNVYFTMPSHSPVYFEYKKKPVYCVLIEKGNRAIEAHTGFTYYQELFIVSDLSEKDMSAFASDAMNEWEKKIDNGNDIEEKIRVSMFDEGYWETLNYKPFRSFDTICLPKGQLEGIVSDIKKFSDPKTEKRYNNLGIPYKRNYLLEGIPGSGKSSLIHAIASELNQDICVLTFHDKINDVTMARALRNIDDSNILVLEDIDSLFVERKKNDENKNRISFSGLLNCLDGLGHKHGLITIMTTNYKMNLDSALIRPGRIDYMMKFDYAVKEQIENMFYKFMNLTKEKDKESGYFKKFYSAFKDLSIQATTSLLQQYFYVYLDKPEEAIENVFEIKEMKENAADSKSNKGMYT